MRAPLSILLLAISGAWLLCGASPSRAQREPPVQKELLERVGFWAERYLKDPPEFTATETRREGRPGKRGVMETREVVSRYVARRDAEARETVSVDGREAPAKAHENTGNLLPERISGPLSLVSRLARETQLRMRYFFAADTADVEVSGDEVVLGYRPLEGEALAEVDGRNVWGSGQAWVHPDDGHIVRAEETFEFKGTRYSTAVDFFFEEELKAWVPRQIVVRLFEKGRMQAERVYTYSSFGPLGASRADTAAPSSKPQ